MSSSLGMQSIVCLGGTTRCVSKLGILPDPVDGLHSLHFRAGALWASNFSPPSTITYSTLFLLPLATLLTVLPSKSYRYYLAICQQSDLPSFSLLFIIHPPPFLLPHYHLSYIFSFLLPSATLLAVTSLSFLHYFISYSLIFSSAWLTSLLPTQMVATSPNS